MSKAASAQARGRLFKNMALVALFSGFALEIGGGIMGNGLVVKTGIFLFLTGIPLFFIGWRLGRRKG